MGELGEKIFNKNVFIERLINKLRQDAAVLNTIDANLADCDDRQMSRNELTKLHKEREVHYKNLDRIQKILSQAIQDKRVLVNSYCFLERRKRRLKPENNRVQKNI